MANPYLAALDDPYYVGDNEQRINEAFEPVRRYLDNARQALEKKQVSCEWKALPPPDAVLSLKQKVYEVHPHGLIELKEVGVGWFEITEDLEDECPLDSDFEPDFDDPVIIGKGKERQNIPITPDEYRQEGGRFLIRLGNVDASKISWTGYSLAVERISADLPESMQVSQQGKIYKINKTTGNQYRIFGRPDYRRTLLHDGKPLKFHYIQSPVIPQDAREINSRLFMASQKEPVIHSAEVKDVSSEFLMGLSLTDLRDPEGRQLSIKWQLVNRDGKLTIDTSGEICPEYLGYSKLPGLELTCQRNQYESSWIQLVSLDHGDDNSVSEDPLEHFFDDQVDILDSNERPGAAAGYRILKARPEERQLLLCRKADKRKSPVLPQGKQLTVRVNLQALIKQQEAITNLKLTPGIEQKPLLDLMKERQWQTWPDFRPFDESSIDWQVLRDLEFDGCDKQREFVAKALATPDFAILDGPPGTGKTTTILELIIQLVRQGKRILLAASTHAAINNVLERVDEHNLTAEIFPLRIGDENRAIGVEHYQYDNLKSEFTNAIDVDGLDRLLVESSNLVCGTTMGILRLFSHKAVNFESGDAPFDVMIIDECSKTTFAEFLVPARYAKRWILVGDVKQLSPFTDREQITANLKQLVLQHKSKNREEVILSQAIQRACLLLNEFRSNQGGVWGYHDKFVVPVSPAEREALANEIRVREQERLDNFEQVLLIGGNEPYQHVNHMTEKMLLQSSWQCYDFNLIFCDEGLLEKQLHLFPADAVVLADSWQVSSHRYRHMARHDGQHKCGHRWLNQKKGESSFYSWEIHHHWLEHNKKASWADEIVWRLEREYWLRFLSGSGRNKAEGIRKQLSQLLPKSVRADGRVYGIRNMAFPSILEALSGSGILKNKNDMANTLNQGFYDKEKQARHTTLTYQHRMHPNISCYPRTQFYSENKNMLSLLDGRRTRADRQWSYSGYDSRAVWVNVDGQNSRSGNEKEVQAIIQQLKRFCDWASQQEKVYDVAILTFYKKQESLLRTKLQALTGQNSSFARFKYKDVPIKLNTVDFFQGQEADLVFLSMVNTQRDGFLDSPNRLNVSVTRARYQLVVVGSYQYFSRKSGSNELRALAQALPVIKE